MQSFHAVVKSLGDARPAWKVLRVLANLMGLPDFNFESSQDVLKQIPCANFVQVPSEMLSNACDDAITLSSAANAVPTVASIYQLDGLVRRATSLQLTADARRAVASTLNINDGATA